MPTGSADAPSGKFKRNTIMRDTTQQHLHAASKLWADAVAAAYEAGADPEAFVTAWLVTGFRLFAKVKGPEAAKALAAMAIAIDEPPAGNC